ncbi:MAG: hypothetical protein B6242_02620 [Anaerolineaceae bacterium 4572_78]|nr:MAG: hypothetical protein B6242_02620 [Anaerolineaceae bacterium 4572_78]
MKNIFPFTDKLAQSAKNYDDEGVLYLIKQYNEEEDGSNYQYLHHAITALQEVIQPKVDDVESSTFLWQTFSKTQNIIVNNIVHLMKKSQDMVETLVDNFAVGIFIYQDEVIRYIGQAGLQILGYMHKEEVIDKPVKSFIYPVERRISAYSSQPKMSDKASVVAPVPIRYETRLRKKDGSTIDVLLYVLAIEYEGKPAVQGMFVDITEQKELKRTIEDILEYRNRQVQTITKIAKLIATVPALSELFQEVVHLIQKQFGYTQVHIYTFKQDILFRVAGTDDTEPETIDLNFEDSIVARAAGMRRPVLEQSMSELPSWLPNVSEASIDVATPIKLEEEVLGVLLIRLEVGERFSAEDQMLLIGLCSQIAVAIDSTDLLEEANIFRQFADASGQGFAITDLEGMVIYANPHLLNILSEEEDENIIDSSIFSYTPEEVRQRFEDEVINIVMEKEQWTDEVFDRLQELSTLQRAMSREGWKTWRETTKMPSGYSFEKAIMRQEDNLWSPEIEEAIKMKNLVYAKSAPKPLNFEGDVQSGVAVAPMIIHNDTIGVLGVYDDEDDPLSQDDLALIKSISEQVALSLESARLFAQTQDALAKTEAQAERLNLLNEMGSALNLAADINEILNVVADNMTNIVQCHYATVILVNEKNSKHAHVYSLNLEDETTCRTNIVSVQAEKFNLEGTHVAEVMRTKRTMIHPSLEAMPGMISAPLVRMRLKSGMIAPLMTSGQVIGALNVGHRELNAYDIHDEQLILQVASLLASTLENRQLLEQAQQRAMQLEKLSQMESDLSQAITESEVVATLALASDNKHMVIVVLHYFETDVSNKLIAFEPKAVWHGSTVVQVPVPEQESAVAKPYLHHHTLHQRFIVQDFPMAKLWIDTPDETLFITDTKTDHRLNQSQKDLMQEFNFQSQAMLPLRSAGRWQGLVSFNYTKPHEFSADEKFILRQIREPLAAIIASRRANLAQQEALAETEILYEAGTELSTAQTYDDIINTLRNCTLIGRDAHNVSIYYFDRPWTSTQKPESVSMLSCWHEEPVENTWTHYLLSEFPLLERLLSHDEPVLIEDIENDSRFVEECPLKELYIKQFQAKSILFVPLVVGGRWIGYINAIYRQPTPFLEKDIRRLTTLSSQAAVAIQNLYSVDLATQRAAQAERLYHAGQRISATNDLQEVITAIVESVPIPAINQAVLMVFEQTQSPSSPLEEERSRSAILNVVANWHSGKGKPPLPIGTQYKRLDNSSVAAPDFGASNTDLTWIDIFKDPSIFYSSNIETENNIMPSLLALLKSQDVKSVMILPLWVGSRQLGMLVLTGEETHEFEERELQAYRSLKTQIAFTIENQRLLKETQTALESVENTQRRYTVQSWETYRSKTRLLGYEQTKEGITFPKDHLPVTVPFAVTKQQTITHNEKQSSDNGSELVVPLNLRGEIIGVLGLQEIDSTRQWSEEEIALVESIAEQFAQAAENLRLLDETQLRASSEARINEISEKIQRAESLEEALQVAIREIGNSLQSNTIVELKGN